MTSIHIDFEWSKDSTGYRLLDEEPQKPAGSLLSGAGKPQRIVPNGGQPIRYAPLSKFKLLYKVFASVKTPDDLLRFIEKYGPLTRRGLKSEAGENVQYLLEQAEGFCAWVNADFKNRKKLADQIGTEGVLMSKLEARLSGDAAGGLRLRITPANLIQALWVQLAQQIAGGTQVRACKHCGEWFETGAGTKRRLDATFCCDDHQRLYNSLKRSRK